MQQYLYCIISLAEVRVQAPRPGEILLLGSALLGVPTTTVRGDE
jgi:hypothetical protein